MISTAYERHSEVCKDQKYWVTGTLEYLTLLDSKCCYTGHSTILPPSRASISNLRHWNQPSSTGITSVSLWSCAFKSLLFPGVHRQETLESLKHAVLLSGFMDLHRLFPQKMLKMQQVMHVYLLLSVVCVCVKTDGETADQFLRRWILSKRLHMDCSRW